MLLFDFRIFYVLVYRFYCVESSSDDAKSKQNRASEREREKSDRMWWCKWVSSSSGVIDMCDFRHAVYFSSAFMCLMFICWFGTYLIALLYMYSASASGPSINVYYGYFVFGLRLIWYAFGSWCENCMLMTKMEISIRCKRVNALNRQRKKRLTNDIAVG